MPTKFFCVKKRSEGRAIDSPRSFIRDNGLHDSVHREHNDTNGEAEGVVCDGIEVENTCDVSGILVLNSSQLTLGDDEIEVKCNAPLEQIGIITHSNSGMRLQDQFKNESLPPLDRIDEENRVVESFNANMLEIYSKVSETGCYNFQKARIPIPSGLNIKAWKKYLVDYTDREILHYLEFGWPSNFNHMASLQSTFVNHKSGVEFSRDIDTYIDVEIKKRALLGPFRANPICPMHISPLMTRPKKDSATRRVVVDLSWPRGLSINDGIPVNDYLGKTVNLTLPTVDYMAERVRVLGPDCYMYKLDLARGYRQLRLDPLDWPLMSIMHGGELYMDICPPFGLRTAALMMQRTNNAACYIHGLQGYVSRPYIDDFGGAESQLSMANSAYESLQDVLRTIGLEVAPHKNCPPSQSMIWLGILVNSVDMTLSIPEGKLKEIQETVQNWDDKALANRKQVQSILGLLNFVGSVAPPVRIYTNRILNFLRGMPMEGYVVIPTEVREDLHFFKKLMPHFNGVAIIDKSHVPPDEVLEVDACLTGCGGLCSREFYSMKFPEFVQRMGHPIAHLEMLNVLVALRLWAQVWQGHKLQIFCDNSNTCLGLQNGRSHDVFMQGCIRAIFLITVAHDIELLVCHAPGTSLVAADALSRSHTGERFREILSRSGCLDGKTEIQPSDELFIVND